MKIAMVKVMLYSDTFHNQPGIAGYIANHSGIDAFVQHLAVLDEEPMDEFVV